MLVQDKALQFSALPGDRQLSPQLCRGPDNLALGFAGDRQLSPRICPRRYTHVPTTPIRGIKIVRGLRIKRASRVIFVDVLANLNKRLSSKLTGRSGSRGAHQTRRSFGLLFSASPRLRVTRFFCPGLAAEAIVSTGEEPNGNVSSKIVSKSRWLFFSLFMALALHVYNDRALPGLRGTPTRQNPKMIPSGMLPLDEPERDPRGCGSGWRWRAGGLSVNAASVFQVPGETGTVGFAESRREAACPPRLGCRWPTMCHG